MPSSFQAPHSPTCAGCAGSVTSKIRKSGFRGRSLARDRVVGLRGLELGVGDGGVDVRLPADGLEPDLVRPARVGGDECQAARMGRVGDVVETETAEGSRRPSTAGLEARHGKLAGERRGLDVLDDRLLRPAASERRVCLHVCVGGDSPRMRGFPNVVHADAQAGAVLSVPAREVRVALVDVDVAAVAAAGIHMRDRLGVGRFRRARSGSRRGASPSRSARMTIRRTSS